MSDRRKKISYPFTPEGKEKLAEILRKARGEKTFPEFSMVVGLNYGTLWEIEKKQLGSITEESLEKLAAYFSSDPKFSAFTKDNLIALIIPRPSLADAVVVDTEEKRHLTFLDVWPLVQRLSDRDKEILLQKLQNRTEV